jgi:hypothetical protein
MGLGSQNGTDGLFPLRGQSIWDRWNLRYLTISYQIWGFFQEILYPTFHKRRKEGKFLPYNPLELYWRSVQPCWLAEKAFWLDARAVPKIVGEFLKPCGNRVQVNCPFSPVLGLSHWKAKISWLCGVRQMQKNVSLRSRQVKNFASAG